MPSNNLGAPRIASGQATNQHTTSNDADNYLDGAITSPLTVVCDATTETLTALQFATNAVFKLTEASPSVGGAITLNVPSTNANGETLKRGFFAVINDTSQDVTVQVSGQAETPPTLNSTHRSILVMDGTNVYLAVPQGVVGSQGPQGEKGDPGSGSTITVANEGQSPEVVNTAVETLRFSDAFTVTDDGAGQVTVGGGGSGKIAQVVNTQTGAVATGTTVMPSDDTIPQNTEGTEFMTLGVTPTDATSTLIIDVHITLSAGTASRALVVALFQDSTADALAATYQWAATANGLYTISFKHKMTAGTASATTFKVRAGPNSAATITINGHSSGSRVLGGVCATSITITEVLP